MIILISDTCTHLPDTENLTTEVVFPVDHGVEIAVDCMAGFTLEGHNTITCVKENVFTETASCKRSEKYYSYHQKCIG